MIGSIADPGSAGLGAEYPFTSAPSNRSVELGVLTRRLAQMLREGTGRGPTAARRHWAGPDTLLALFGDGCAKVEETLIRQW